MHSSDQGSTGETSKMPIATDTIREGFSGKQNCLRQTQELLGGIVNPQLSDLKEPGTSKLDWRLSIDIIEYHVVACYCKIDRNELQIRKNLHKGTGTKMTDKLNNLTEEK